MRRSKRLCTLLLAVIPTVCMGLACLAITRDYAYDYEEPCNNLVSVSNTLADAREYEEVLHIEPTVISTLAPTATPAIVYSLKEDVSTEAQEIEVYDATPCEEVNIVVPTYEELQEIKKAEEFATADNADLITLSSSTMNIVTFTSPKGNVYVFDTERLNSIYSSTESFKDMGLGDYNGTAAVIYDFLVFQMGVEHNIACGIIGNCAAEGTFGKKQSVKRYISSIEEARKWLDKDAVDTGYGIAQWTTGGRRERLLEYYEAAVKTFDKFEDAQKVAELVNLYEEIIDYEVFDSYDDIVTVEDATGRISLFYERYKYSAQDWSPNKNGTVSLTGDVGSGEKRLKYAYRVHNFYKDLP